MMQFSKLNLILLLLNVSGVFGAPKVPCLYIFGDSIVDSGNNNYRETTAKVNYFPYGIDFPEGPTGRFTNGRNLADFLAELLGFEKYIPPFANATNEDLTVGVNYASGGAGILEESGAKLGNVISFNEQLSNHATAISRLAELLGDKDIAKLYLSRCMYSIVLGSNDFLLNYFPKFYSRKTPFTPQQFAAFLVNKYSKQLQSLYHHGARKVGVFAVGKLGCVPQEVATYGASEGSSCVDTHNEAVVIFNDKLKLLMAELNDKFNDAEFIFTRNTAFTYENLTNLKDPCCELSHGHCRAGARICSNRNEYVFWDEVHPTEAVYLMHAKSALTDMFPLYTDLVDIW